MQKNSLGEKFVLYSFATVSQVYYLTFMGPSSGAYNCVSSLWFLPLEHGGSSVVGRGLATLTGQTTTNNAATATLQW
jgi:hypothetical protein